VAVRSVPSDTLIYSLLKLSWCAAYGRIKSFKTATDEDLKSFQRDYQSRVTQTIQQQRELMQGDEEAMFWSGGVTHSPSMQQLLADGVGPDYDDLCCKDAHDCLKGNQITTTEPLK
jgi:hypothetical protein